MYIGVKYIFPTKSTIMQLKLKSMVYRLLLLSTIIAGTGHVHDPTGLLYPSLCLFISSHSRSIWEIFSGTRFTWYVLWLDSCIRAKWLFDIIKLCYKLLLEWNDKIDRQLLYKHDTIFSMILVFQLHNCYTMIASRQICVGMFRAVSVSLHALISPS